MSKCRKEILKAEGIVDQNNITKEAYIKDSFCFSIKSVIKSQINRSGIDRDIYSVSW